MALFLAKSVLLVPFGHLALASQSQIPVRTGDCVLAVHDLEYFYKDEGEYERTHRVMQNQAGVLLNLGEGLDPSDVEWLRPDTRDPLVTGAAFSHQIRRVPWVQGKVIGMQSVNQRNEVNHALDRCLTVTPDQHGYQPVIRMSECSDPQNKAWQQQQFTFGDANCGARPIRWSKDPSKCIDVVHHQHAILADCTGADSQKFLWRCDPQGPHAAGPPPGPAEPECYIQRAGRKDMCLWWDRNAGDANLELRSCNHDAQNGHRDAGETRKFTRRQIERSAPIEPILFPIEPSENKKQIRSN